MGKTFKLSLERRSRDDPGMWETYFMDCFGKGYSLREAETMKHHLESMEEYRSIQIIEMTGEVTQ